MCAVPSTLQVKVLCMGGGCESLHAGASSLLLGSQHHPQCFGADASYSCQAQADVVASVTVACSGFTEGPPVSRSASPIWQHSKTSSQTNKQT